MRLAAFLLVAFGLTSLEAAAGLPSFGAQLQQFLQGAEAESDTTLATAEERRLERSSIEARLAAAEADLEATERRAEEAREEGAEELLSDLTELVEAQQRRALLYERQLQLLEDTEDIRRSAEAAAEDYALKTAAFEDETKKLSVLEYDELWDELQIALEQVGVLAEECALEEEGLAEAKRAISDRERDSRLRREEFDTSEDPTRKAALSRRLLLAELRQETATETYELHSLRFEQATAQQAKFQAVVDLLQARLARTEGRVTFDEDTRQKLNAELDELEDSLETQRTKALRQAAVLDDRWMFKSETVQTSDPDDPFLPLYRAQLETVSQERDRWKTEARTLATRLSLLGQRRALWEKRWRALTGALDVEGLRALVAESRQSIAELDSEEQSIRVRLEPLRKRLRLLQASIEGPLEGDARIRDLQTEQGNQLKERVRSLEDGIAGIEAVRRLNRLIIDQYGVERRSFTGVMRDAWSWVKKAWIAELYVSDDKNTVIRVWQTVIGLMLLLFGFKAAGILTRFIGAHVLPRFGVEPAAAVAIRTILFYLLLVTFVLLALRTVNVPLTAFTVLGGALAIGVGFGSQNIVNNFISGLILLVEQPIRVGDLIQIHDLYGTVERVGARSTRVRTGQNVEILVPNSSFLESNVINLTLTDNKIRTHVSVGVAYGSPVRDVVKLLKAAAEEHGRVLNSPEPRVIFAEFGDNALAFELHFWIRTNQVMDRRMIESDIRSKIDAVFRGANISIAFPQRDIHLDLSEPLRVSMVPPDDPSTPSRSQDGASSEGEKPDKPNLPG